MAHPPASGDTVEVLMRQGFAVVFSSFIKDKDSFNVLCNKIRARDASLLGTIMHFFVKEALRQMTEEYGNKISRGNLSSYSRFADLATIMHRALWELHKGENCEPAEVPTDEFVALDKYLIDRCYNGKNPPVPQVSAVATTVWGFSYPGLGFPENPLATVMAFLYRAFLANKEAHALKTAGEPSSKRKVYFHKKAYWVRRALAFSSEAQDMAPDFDYECCIDPNVHQGLEWVYFFNYHGQQISFHCPCLHSNIIPSCGVFVPECGRWDGIRHDKFPWKLETFGIKQD